MSLHMTLTLDNLKALKDLGYELSDISEDVLKGVHNTWGKRIHIAFGVVSIHSGDVLPMYSCTVTKASEALTLFKLGMTEGVITKVINQSS